MADSTMLQLPVAPSVDGSEYAWINQGGTDKRTTLSAIANTATGFIPSSRVINTPATGGLSGGGSLAADLTLTFAPSGLNAKTSMVVADAFAINDSTADTPAKVTFPNAMKALTGLTALAIPAPLDDYLIINRASDGLTYKINPSALSLASGNVPAGGTTGQPLVKASNTDYDTEWSTLGPTVGGTGITAYTLGDIVYASAANTLSALAGNTTSAKQYLSQTGTGVASQAPAWATVSGSDITGAALTAANDTNVTLTLGGTPATALLRAASITPGWVGQLGLTRGGTAASLTASNGGIVYSTSSALAILAGTATANQILLSGSSTTPAWSSTTFPATTAQGDILYASALNTISTLAKNTTATRYLANTGSSNNPAWDQVSLTTGIIGTLGVGNGGTGIANPTAHDLLIGNGSSAMTQLAPSATSGVPLISQGASADPAYGTAVVAGGGTGATSFTAYTVLCGGTTTTGALQNVASVGTSGQALLSAGAGALPAFGDVLRPGVTSLITIGYTVTPYNIGTISSGTVTPSAANSNYQYLTNNGAFTLAAPSADSAIDILITNAGSAGSITFSGFTVGSSTGSAYVTTNTYKFILSIRRINGVSTYSFYALQ